MNKKLSTLAIALALAGAYGAANATDLTPGHTISPVPILGAAPAGTLLDSVSTLITTPTFMGTLRSAVYDGPEAGINLDFYYQFTNSASSANAIARVTGYDFSGWHTDVYQTAHAFGQFLAGNVTASTADRDTQGTVGFNMPPIGNEHGKLLPGMTSDTFIIRTRAQTYFPGWAGVIDGTAGYSPAFSPAIPEPETNALIVAGLGLMGFVVRRRTKREKK